MNHNISSTVRYLYVIFIIVILLCVGGTINYYFSEKYGHDKSLVGMSEFEVSKKFPLPVSVSEFNPYFESRDDRVGIRDLYPPKISESNIIVKEYKFIYKPLLIFRKRYITIWFHKKDNNWIVADTFWYDDRINF